jgi:hypothetical protein
MKSQFSTKTQPPFGASQFDLLLAVSVLSSIHELIF